MRTEVEDVVDGTMISAQYAAAPPKLDPINADEVSLSPVRD